MPFLTNFIEGAGLGRTVTSSGAPGEPMLNVTPPRLMLPKPTDPTTIRCGERWLSSKWHKPRRGCPGYFELTTNMVVETMGRRGLIESMRSANGFDIYKAPFGVIVEARHADE